MINKKIIIELFKILKRSRKVNDFPVAAIVYKDNKIIGKGYNKRHKSHITTDHAEIVAIREANRKIKNWNLQGYSMIVTLEPCKMCESVIREARLDTVYYLVPRYSTKNQYKKTSFSKYQYDNEILNSYIDEIESFFKFKR